MILVEVSSAVKAVLSSYVLTVSATIYHNRNIQTVAPLTDRAEKLYWRSVTGGEGDENYVKYSKPVQSRRKEGITSVKWWFAIDNSLPSFPVPAVRCNQSTPSSTRGSTPSRVGGAGRRGLGVTLILSSSRMLWRGSNG